MNNEITKPMYKNIKYDGTLRWTIGGERTLQQWSTYVMDASISNVPENKIFSSEINGEWWRKIFCERNINFGKS